MALPMLEALKSWVDLAAHVTFDEDTSKKKPVIKTGAEIPFTRYFYKYEQPEDPADVLAEVLSLDERAHAGLAGLRKAAR